MCLQRNMKINITYMKTLCLSTLLLLIFIQVDAQLLTRREVYDLHIGDELGIKISQSGPLVHKWLRVIDRKDIGQDSIVLSYYERKRMFSFQGEIFSQDTFDVSYGNLNSLFFKYFKLGYRIKIDSLQGRPFSYRENKDSIYKSLCGREVNYSYSAYSGEAYSENKTSIAYKGLGTTYNYFYYAGGIGSEDYKYETLEFYIKDGDTCGNKIDFPVNNLNVNIQPKLFAFPNPCVHSFQITGANNFSYTLYDLLGNKVQSGLANEDTEISTEELANGIYCVEIKSNNKSSYCKIYINHSL